MNLFLTALNICFSMPICKAFCNYVGQSIEERKLIWKVNFIPHIAKWIIQSSLYTDDYNKYFAIISIIFTYYFQIQKTYSPCTSVKWIRGSAVLLSTSQLIQWNAAAWCQSSVVTALLCISKRGGFTLLLLLFQRPLRTLVLGEITKLLAVQMVLSINKQYLVCVFGCLSRCVKSNK